MGDQEERLRKILERMKPRDREILLLRHREGLSIAECAKRLGLTVRAATTRLLRAARHLRELLSSVKAGEGLGANEEYYPEQLGSVSDWCGSSCS